MKKVFTLFVCAVTALTSNAQVVLNEVYTDPGNGKHEFFEFYNISSNPVPENVDNYTMISYYEEQGNKSGFYVLDLPNQSIMSKGFYVGSSGEPFNVQGKTSIAPDFNWQSIPQGGSLTKWQKNGNGYLQVSIPENFNDLFVSNTGNGATHHIFIYKNGILINGLITGANFAIIDPYIKAMPNLPVDMSGSSPDFTAVFSALSDNQVEYVNSVAGNDNGYIRLNDGKCGVWDKSSTQVQHSPGTSNGSATGISGDLTISSYITNINGDNVKSLLVYNITAGTLSAFPVIIEAYRDLGILGQLDAADILVDSRQITNAISGDQAVVFPFNYEAVMLVAKSPSGCFDRVIWVQNLLSTLPVHLISFQGNMNKNNKVTLQWKVADNQTVSHFEVQRSSNGKDFATIGLVLGSEKTDVENYMFYETVNSTNKVMYRLIMIDKQQDASYSKILVFQNKSASTPNLLKIFSNPVNDKLTFSFTSSSSQTVDVKVYDMSGRLQMNQKVTSYEGSNMVSLPLSSNFKPGFYVVEVNDGTERQIAKFVKQ